MSTILRNPDALAMADLGVVDIMEHTICEALSGVGAAEALEAKLPESVVFDLGVRLAAARRELEAALAVLATIQPDPAAPAGVAKNVPVPVVEVEVVALMRAA